MSYAKAKPSALCHIGRWCLPDATSVVEDQQWILTAMTRHGAPLIAMLWRILGNEQDVCDAYQDTFLKLSYCCDGRKPEKLKAYLFRTASNTAISMIRRRMVRDRVHEDIANHANRSGQYIDNAGDLDTQELQRELRSQIARLPDHLRSVVVLRDLGEMPYKEVGKTLGISPRSARVLRCRAIKMLALVMNKSNE
ncbi:MAG: sigma-70 family RNA polymerase sigma factor [Phycisphaerae bacterium]|nr:sigma-70 family RNA polymerase sigma factor [Phycisphaerae bacterium]